VSTAAAYHGHFEPRPESGRVVRRALTHALADWGLDGFADDATLCASELAANAVLHAASPFEVVARPVGDGVRVEIVDRHPELVPTVVPRTGTARLITARGTTGRGLQLVAALAHRWGYTTSQASKSVWFELGAPARPEPTDPIVVDGYVPEIDPTARQFHLESLPVRAAVASGVHVEELVREIQLPGPAVATHDEVARELADLLRVSAPARLLGRHAAFSAAARNERRFTLDVRLSREHLSMFGVLNQLLTAVSLERGIAVIPLTDDVIAFRRWVIGEVTRQSEGSVPTQCPLPD
jgi:anti-sigma regulatory factor (Ser/Thr protein kinase)